MTNFHLVRVVWHLIAGLLTSAVVFPLVGAAGRERLIRRWSAKLIGICGVVIRVRDLSGGVDAQPALIVANHVSWLDIFVINSLQPCRFVAKSDIRDWPLIGWLCEKAGTIFIARGRQRDVRRIFEGLVTSIHAGERVAFFPEGTTVAQGQVLPFHANLFEAAIDARVPVRPYAIKYLDAADKLHPAADFIGDMTFAESMVAILKSRRFVAELTLLPLIETEGAHRRDLAATARAAIAGALGYAVEPFNPGRASGIAGTLPETTPGLPVSQQ